MMALVEFDDPGLQLLPYHRGIGGISSADLGNIRKELDNLCGKDETAHQGLVAEVEQLEEITLKEFVIENKNKNFMNKYQQNHRNDEYKNKSRQKDVQQSSKRNLRI